ncbi:hypothetical protein K435DRAFT_854995 [Dendrothele bispora CBS 962.96]|uniref:SWIM-type domain-containing protein n=1 Tax=Dendrothele bispora (strain CBS 962.96) TaxID=1314807 RepID=A0A4S8MCC5_DENBC|nr:hypothetical protein K435DRAFT_854995 [Dendrothele bispora CBS 962.96]
MSQQAGCEEYVKVTVRDTGALQCSCQHWRQTGKTCAHTFAVHLLITCEPASEYIDNEVVLKTRGRNAKAMFPIPPKPKGHQQPPRKDETVNKDVQHFFDTFNQLGDEDPFPGSQPGFDSDEDQINKTDQEDNLVEIDSSQTIHTTHRQNKSSSGRPPAIKPLQPSRSKALVTATKVKTTIFREAPGPKKERLHPLSLQAKGPAATQKIEAGRRSQGIANLEKITANKDSKTAQNITADQQLFLADPALDPALKAELLLSMAPPMDETDAEAILKGTVTRWKPPYHAREDEIWGFSDLLKRQDRHRVIWEVLHTAAQACEDELSANNAVKLSLTGWVHSEVFTWVPKTGNAIGIARRERGEGTERHRLQASALSLTDMFTLVRHLPQEPKIHFESTDKFGSPKTMLTIIDLHLAFTLN